MLNPAAHVAFKQHALACYPDEACGVLVAGSFIACKNVAEKPRETFRIAADELARVGLEKGRVEAVLHTHPYHPRMAPKWPAEWPTSTDMASWLQGATPWGIAATDGEGLSRLVWLDDSIIPPLKGRPFVSGVTDCYSLVRDYFRLERGVTLPNYARDIDWFEKGQDLYSENFHAAGFVEISPKEVKPGDCALFKVKSRVINHAAVITGMSTILHHLFHKVSGEDSLARWSRVIEKYVRYVGAPS